MDTAEDFQMPEDFFFARNEAAELAGEQATMELDAGTQLFLLEFSKITKMGGSTSLRHFRMAGDSHSIGHRQRPS